MRQDQYKSEDWMDNRIRATLIAIAIAVGFAFGSVQAASFDCGKAGSKVEKLICTDTDLSKLDEQLATVYGFVTKEAQDEEDLRTQQQTWLRVRDRCTSVPCIRAAYERRIAALLGPGPYVLKMSKDATLCSAMLALYNADNRSYGRVEYDRHEMFTRLWQPVELNDAAHPTYGCLRYWRGEFDINNDGEDELVIKRSACLAGILTDNLFIYPKGTSVPTFDHESGKPSQLEDTSNELGDHTYFLRSLAGQPEIWVGGHFVINPFILGRETYISMTDQDPRWFVIAKYKQREEMQDICYFFNAKIKHQF